MDELSTLRAQLALEIEFTRQRLRRAWTAFPPRPEFRWEGSSFSTDRDAAAVANRALLDAWKEEIRVWKAENGIASLPGALAALVDAA